MNKKKVFVLLSDGVGFRNYAYSGFNNLGVKMNFEMVYWNNTPFPLNDLGFNEIRIKQSKPHPVTDILKKAKVQIELNLNILRANDTVYDTYRFPFDYSTLNAKIKSACIHLITPFLSSEKGLSYVRRKIKDFERTTSYYQESLKTLQEEKPAIVFCTNQRHVNTIAPLVAACDLGIPTACFIYSWDNLPKATLVVETDYYFVWSDYMKSELQYYYPHIKPEQIYVTGSPQFEMHYQTGPWLQRDTFFQKFGLNKEKKYVCFSGNDVTSSPDDPKYLEDIALAVRELNANGQHLGIIFRKCPVDFSDRFDEVIKKYSQEIVAIDPLWKKFSSSWNAILPGKEDDELLAGIAEHCELVITIGSSTIFDFIAHNKPCAYLKYNQKNQLDSGWDIYRCYQYVHFRSMPNPDCVFWIDSAEAIASVIKKGLNDSASIVQNAKTWFQVINQPPPQEASHRILEAIEEITG